MKMFDPNFTCFDCGKDTCNGHDYYVVWDYLWKKFGVGDGMLCIQCFEKRIGRKLTKEDFVPCPVNVMNKFVQSIQVKGGSQ